MLRLALHWQILIALILAVIAGQLSGTEAGIAGVSFYAVYDFLGTLFLNALKMLIVPLIMASIISGIAGVGQTGSLGRLGGRTLLYYLASSLIAILIGLTLVNLISPGIVDGEPARDIIGLQAADAELEQVAGRDAGDIADVFLRMIPPNIIDAATNNGQMLGVIFFSLLFGYFMARIEAPYAESLYTFWQGVYEVMMRITDLVMRFAPLGVFALVARVMADTGLGAFVPLLSFALTVLAALALHAFVALPLILMLVARVRPGRHYRAVAPAMLTAFSSASSSATLPITMECVQDNAKVSRRTSSFVLPLGATVNMDGTALYECVAAIFIAQAYGLDLSLAQQFSIVVIALLTSVGVAGIPAASLVAITIILAAIGLPAEAIGLILAVDRILDMCRTSVNVFSDSCAAVVIGKLEGETGILADEVREARRA